MYGGRPQMSRYEVGLKMFVPPTFGKVGVHFFHVGGTSKQITIGIEYTEIYCLVGTSHARTVVRECCKGDDESQWERGKFDPPPPKNPLTDGHQNLCR